MADISIFIWRYSNLNNYSFNKSMEVVLKKVHFIILIFLIFTSRFSYGQVIFSQDFSSSTTLSDYFNDPPTANQFRLVKATSGASATIVSNSLVMTRTTGGSAYAERNTDFSAIPSIMIFKFDLTVSGGGDAANVLRIYVGGDVVNGATAPTNANVFARLFFNTTATSGEFIVKDISNNTTSNNIYSGKQTITWVLNNSGGTQIYAAPDASSESLTDNTADVWVDNTLEFDDIDVETPTQTLARFKFLASSTYWLDGTSFTLDNISISDASGLPVELSSFTGYSTKDKVTLKWQTATEVNNYGFDIERKQGTENWNKIGFVAGSGNSNSPKSYSYTDSPTGGTSFSYRLKQIDYDGNFEYYDAITVLLNGSDRAKLLQNNPNPFNPSTAIKFYIPNDSKVRIAIYDILGREVTTLLDEQKQAGYHIVYWNGNDKNGIAAASGIYLYRLTVGNYVKTKKMNLLK